MSLATWFLGCCSAIITNNSDAVDAPNSLHNGHLPSFVPPPSTLPHLLPHPLITQAQTSSTCSGRVLLRSLAA